jgi:excisionase family DNA binding protein
MIVLEDEYLTPDEVAKKLRVDQDTVLRWLKNHQLGGYKIGHQWRISLTDYAKFLKERYNIDTEKEE